MRVQPHRSERRAADFFAEDLIGDKAFDSFGADDLYR
jgi:hypothetical protein